MIKLSNTIYYLLPGEHEYEYMPPKLMNVYAHNNAIHVCFSNDYRTNKLLYFKFH